MTTLWTLSRKPLSHFLRPVLLVTGVMICCGITQQAFAQVTNLADAQQQVSSQIVILPRLIATIAYVSATFFAATGLLKLKDWINEPEKNPINSALFRIVVSALLLFLPKMLYLTNSSLFGFQANGNSQDNNVQVPMHSLSTFK